MWILSEVDVTKCLFQFCFQSTIQSPQHKLFQLSNSSKHFLRRILKTFSCFRGDKEMNYVTAGVQCKLCVCQGNNIGNGK